MKKIVTLLFILFLCSCSVNSNENINSIEDLNGKNMGCMSGSIFDKTIEEKLEKSKVVYFNSRSELIMGVQLNKISGYISDKPVAIVCCNENDNIKYLDEPLDSVEYGFCFSEDAEGIKKQFNEFLNKMIDDGSLIKLQDKWISEDCMDQEIGLIELDGENGTIKACTTPDAAPFSFIKNNKHEGYEVELLTLFAKEYGYNLDISDTSFDALISAVASNKFDIAFNGIFITEERKKSVDFSDITYKSSVVPIVRNDFSNSSNLFETIKEKIYKTFVDEDRYMIILKGMRITLLITVASLLLGTILGFAFFLLSRRLGSWFAKIISFFSSIFSGLPIVVILMIFFYVVFADTSFSGELVSIIGFSLLICFAVYKMLKTGVGAIDKGQYEGAIALGYTDTKAFFKFVLPQALKIIMPSYQREIVTLIKSSSIVGYITVEDLTRASDIIRSRTYDAFFPLVITAVLYFVISILLTKIIDVLQKRFLPSEKNKEEILKKFDK